MKQEIVVSRLGGEPEAAATRVLSDAERRRADRFAFARDRRRFVFARARLRELLGVHLRVAPERVELVYGPCGKPALAARFAEAGLHFNVSHREDLAVYAFSRRGRIGVDVEAVHEFEAADSVAASVFSRRENQMYRALPRAERALGFFNCWTRKEAFVKATGDGLSRPLGGFDVSLAPGEPARFLRIDDTPGDDCGWRMESFTPAPGFVAAVVSEVA